MLPKFGSTSAVRSRGLISAGQLVRSTAGQRPWLWIDVVNGLGECITENVADFETKRSERGEETGVLSEDPINPPSLATRAKTVFSLLNHSSLV